MSLTKGDFNEDWKTAIVRILLEKPGLELIHKNYRPVSNLCFLSKLVEWCMLWQLLDHCTQQDLIPDSWSAYRKNYSTERSLIKMTNDILLGFENQNITSIVIPDLSAAFDTVDHDVLLTILWDLFVFQGTTLKWFENYLHPRYFKFAIEGKYSKSKELTFSVPQGSCSGANLFPCYSSLIHDQINNSIALSGFMMIILFTKTLKQATRIKNIKPKQT